MIDTIRSLRAQTNIAEFINMAENAGILPKSATGGIMGLM